MKIADLKKLIAELPDEMEVVVSGSDHSYNFVGRGTSAIKAEAWYDTRNRIKHLGQYWDGAENNEDNPGKIIEVFWIDDGRY
jgi:membrane protein implicated in regulation of membrane protease activity